MITRYNKVIRRQDESKRMEILEVFHIIREMFDDYGVVRI